MWFFILGLIELIINYEDMAWEVDYTCHSVLHIGVLKLRSTLREMKLESEITRVMLQARLIIIFHWVLVYKIATSFWWIVYLRLHVLTRVMHLCLQISGYHVAVDFIVLNELQRVSVQELRQLRLLVLSLQCLQYVHSILVSDLCE